MKINTIIFVVITVLLLPSCFSKNDGSSVFQPTISGKSGEVLVIMNNNLWKAAVGDSVRHLLKEEQLGLPQAEPMFDVQQITQEAFGDIFSSFRNIIFINPSDESDFLITRDKWAKGQLIIYVTGKTSDDIIEQLSEHGDDIVSRILNVERERTLSNYLKHRESSIYTSLIKNHGIGLTIPLGYNIDKDEEDFVWISKETSATTQAILIYTQPYTSTDAFLKDNLVAKRNEVCKKHIEGEDPGSYMTTSKIAPVSYKKFKFKGRFHSEIRGFWELENGFQGGPFVSMSTVDEANGRIVTVEGFVYAPKTEKRSLIRQMEAIIYSLEFIEKPEPKE